MAGWVYRVSSVQDATDMTIQDDLERWTDKGWELVSTHAITWATGGGAETRVWHAAHFHYWRRPGPHDTSSSDAGPTP